MITKCRRLTMGGDEVPSSASNIMGVRHGTTTARRAIGFQKNPFTQPKGQREEVRLTARLPLVCRRLTAFYDSAIGKDDPARLAVIRQRI
jgi:hypothetical protein